MKSIWASVAGVRVIVASRKDFRAPVLHHNPSGQFHTFGYPGIYFHSRGHPIVSGRTID